jgi:hypothetical protein
MIEEARKSISEALTLLAETNKNKVIDSASILWKATESLDYASLLISLSYEFSDFVPEIEVNVDDDVQSALRTIKDDLKKSIGCLENSPRGSYILLKKTISSLRVIRKVS